MANSAKILDRYPFTRMLLRLVGLLAGGGIVLIGIHGWQERSAGVFAAGALVASAAGAVGALGGFLFGLPRFAPARMVDTPAEPGPLAVTRQALAGAGVLTPGTNLEQVSDWLTKLLLGAGLTQLGRLGTWFGAFVDGLAVALTGVDPGAAPATRVLAGSIVIFYAAVGFLFGYMMTALWYYRRLRNLLEPEPPEPTTEAEPAAPVPAVA